jgi:hypothetical protein
VAGGYPSFAVPPEDLAVGQLDQGPFERQRKLAELVEGVLEGVLGFDGVASRRLQPSPDARQPGHLDPPPTVAGQRLPGLQEGFCVVEEPGAHQGVAVHVPPRPEAGFVD